MKLLYKINFNSTNGYFKNIINDLIQGFDIHASCLQYKTFLLIECNDSEEKIQAFFKHLESHLPLSIFLNGAQVIESLPKDLEPLSSNTTEQKIAILPSKIIEIYNQSSDYEKEANALKAGEIISIQTSNGLMKLSLPNKENRESLGKNTQLMIVNLNAIKELLAVSPKDIQLLSSIERPLVKLKFNILKNSDFAYAATNFIYTRLPSDEIEYALATALRKVDINFVIYTIESEQNELKVTYTDEQNIIISGDKALFPKYDYTLDKTYASSNEYFEQNGGVFKATLSQFNKRTQASIGIYLSMKSSQSCIAVNLPSKGVTPIIKVPNVLNDFENCLNDIANIDENTPRLIENYKKKFPEVFETAPMLENTDGFETILNLTAHMIGLKDVHEFEAKAIEFNAKSGINVDFVVVKIDGMNYLDYRRVVQSIMSYKMAGVESNMLAFSFYESLSEFIADNVSKIKSEMGARDVVLCGDLFANSTLLAKTQKALKTYNVMIPKEYPLDID